jgi:hypothetical protein
MCVIGEGPDVSRVICALAAGIEDIEEEDPPPLHAVMLAAATQIVSDNVDFCTGNCSYSGVNPVGAAGVIADGAGVRHSVSGGIPEGF